MKLNTSIDGIAVGTNILDIEVPEALRKRHPSGLKFFDDALGGKGFTPSAGRRHRTPEGREGDLSLAGPGALRRSRGQRVPDDIGARGGLQGGPRRVRGRAHAAGAAPTVLAGTRDGASRPQLVRIALPPVAARP